MKGRPITHAPKCGSLLHGRRSRINSFEVPSSARRARCSIVASLLAALFLPASLDAADRKPILTELNPPGMQRGETAAITITGSNLVALTRVRFTDTNLTGKILDSGTTNEAAIEIRAPADLARGAYEFAVVNTNGESGKLKLYVDDWPQLSLHETNPSPRTVQHPEKLPALPVGVWGKIEKPGDMDAFEFTARAGETIVLELEARSVGSKLANGELTVLDDQGRIVAQNNGFDGGDPLLAFTASREGRFTVRVSDRMASGSREHSYRLTLGAIPYVTGVFPLGIPAHQTSEVRLVGWNLGDAVGAAGKAGPSAGPRDKAFVSPFVMVNASAPGEVEAPVDGRKFRSRRKFKVIASVAPEIQETEPNDTVSSAGEIPIPGAVNGRLWRQQAGGDVDLFRFYASAGRRLVLETQAAQRCSPTDTRIEILDDAGRPVPRLKLQAVRDSFISFRGIDSNQQGARLENWEEMELNNYIYLNGEVARLFRMPQGPDSDLLFYASAGKRRSYFDGTATGHALDEPCYVVEPRELTDKLVGNGLPVFTVNYSNDDDGERKLGTDSKVYFTSPSSSDYLVRVTDSRGFSGDRFAYRLVVRDAQPDFTVTLNGANPSVPRGSAQSFSVNVDRTDGFDAEVRVEITNVPPGFIVSSPLLVEAGHSDAKGTVFAATNAVTTTNADIRISATAKVDGKMIVKTVSSLGQIKVTDMPKLFVSFEPYTSPAETNLVTPPDDRPFEITIAPGQTVPAWLKIRRNGHKDLVTFLVENLPHGVIVDNIGLNGVLIPKEDNERQIFLACAKWVAEQDRLCYAVEQNAGRQTSRPLLLRVRRSATTAAR